MPPGTQLKATLTPKWPIDEEGKPKHQPDMLEKATNSVGPGRWPVDGFGTVQGAGDFEFQVRFKSDAKLKYGEYKIMVSTKRGPNQRPRYSVDKNFLLLDERGVKSTKERQPLRVLKRAVAVLDKAVKRGGFVGTKI